jgi:hypothetical protein
MTPKILIIIIIFEIKKFFIITRAALCTQGEEERLSVLREVERGRETAAKVCNQTRGLLLRILPRVFIGARERAAGGGGAVGPAHLGHGVGNGDRERGMGERRGTCAHVLYQAGTAECQRRFSGTVGQRQMDNRNPLGTKNASGSPQNASKPGYPCNPLLWSFERKRRSVGSCSGRSSSLWQPSTNSFLGGLGYVAPASPANPQNNANFFVDSPSQLP